MRNTVDFVGGKAQYCLGILKSILRNYVMNVVESLKPNAIDRMTSIAKGIAGCAPVIGPMMAEIVGNIIPNQRIDRLCRFVTVLDQKVSALENMDNFEAFKSEPAIDLLEDAFHQASRAITSERLDYIAELVKNSLTDEQLNYAHGKAMLSVLNQISDAEIILLQFYAKQTSDDFDEYYETHKGVIEGPPPSDSKTSDLYNEAAHVSHINHLVQLGLIKSGETNRGSKSVTMIGRLLLRLIGLDDGLRGMS